MKQMEVQIMGQSYLLGCPEGGETGLMAAVERVDAAMCKIRDGGKVKARERIAVLAALNLAFDLGEKEAHIPPDTQAAATGQPRTTGEEAYQAVILNSLLKRLDAALGKDGRLI
jgi:cell division protein ZapA